jgi:hypothetical protein
MTVVMNLVPGQYQFGDIVFGKHTTVRVENFDIKPYDLAAMDYQTSRSDEMHFGWDQIKPTTIEITFDILYSKMLPQYEHLIPNFWDEMPTVDDFANAWRADEVRYSWGEMKPLYACGRDFITRTIYGRPGAFTYPKDSEYTEVLQCLAEFRRADAFAYAVNERAVLLSPSQTTETIHGTVGNAPSWFRILLEGPVVNPTFSFTNLIFGDVIFNLGYTVAPGETVEINGYPWSRRTISSNGQNLSADLIGDTPYLDRMRFDSNAEVTCVFGGTGMTDDTKALLLWRDGYASIK